MEDGEDTELSEEIAKTKSQLKAKKRKARQERLKKGISDAEYKKQRKIANKEARLDKAGQTRAKLQKRAKPMQFAPQYLQQF